MKRATNSALMRIKNEKIILSIINKGAVSRADIAKKTGLTKAAVTIIVDDLMQRGILTERDEEPSESGMPDGGNGKKKPVGRSPIMLYLNEKAFFVIGINITRRHITVGITDLGGNTVAEDELPVSAPKHALDAIAEVIEAQLSAAKLPRSKIYKVSVAAPGPVDAESGIILSPPNFGEWHNVPVADELRARTGFNVMLSNVSSATAVAEKYFGGASDAESFLTLRVDEGIGSGIVIGDTLFKGLCEIGHTSVRYDGIECECGNRGCLEKYAAIPRLLAGTEYKGWREAADAAEERECEAERLLEAEAEYLSAAIISADNIFDFERIILCGDLAYKPERITKSISERVNKSVLKRGMLKSKPLEVCAGKVKSKLIIAASMAVDDFFN